MRLEFEVELPDAPGELSRVLEVVARHGGNVQSVIHRHERATSGGVPVVFMVDVEEGAAIGLLDALARGNRLLRVNREGGPVRTSLLVVGHVFEADLKGLLELGFEAGAEVGSLDARINGRANPSAVLFTLSADDRVTLAGATERVRTHAREQGLTVIEEAGGESGG